VPGRIIFAHSALFTVNPAMRIMIWIFLPGEAILHAGGPIL
jgi:hypothetical protein